MLPDKKANRMIVTTGREEIFVMEEVTDTRNAPCCATSKLTLESSPVKFAPRRYAYRYEYIPSTEDSVIRTVQIRTAYMCGGLDFWDKSVISNQSSRPIRPFFSVFSSLDGPSMLKSFTESPKTESQQ